MYSGAMRAVNGIDAVSFDYDNDFVTDCPVTDSSEHNINRPWKIHRLLMDQIQPDTPAFDFGKNPPDNYGVVCHNDPRRPWELGQGHAVYRSSFPKPEDYEFLKRLKLKTIL
jgi:hypothetical protein